MNIEELQEIFKAGGIVGAGGAGFPSYAKLNKKADTIILNCAECEPLLNLHRRVLEKYAEEILTALSEVAESVQANRIIIAIKPSYRGAVEAVKSCIKNFNKCEIGFLPEAYPAGDEVVAIYETTGRVVKPGQIPISVGVIVFNVETMLNAYNAITSGKPVTSKYISVMGEVKNPVTLKAPIGITYNELIEKAGGVTTKEYVLIAGGPMMGKMVSGHDVVTKTSNAIIVLPSDHHVVQKHKSNPSVLLKRGMSACCQCHMCTDMCPRHLLGHPIDPAKFMRSLTSGSTSNITPYVNALFCSGCGLCEMYSCFQGLSPRKLIGVVKGKLRQAGVTAPKIDSVSVPDERSGRYVLKSRLTARLGLSKYDVTAALNDKEVSSEKVKVMLNQHIGAPAIPTVKKGDKIKKGSTIAAAPAEKLGVAIHASISGLVTAVNQDSIVISKQ